MGAFFVYILKASACLAVFYLFYRQLLSKETFHRFNRIALLSLVLLSVLIPLCQITVKEPIVMQPAVMNLEQLLMMATLVSDMEVLSTPLWIKALLCIYLVGGAVFFMLFCYSCIRMYGLMRKGKKEKTVNGAHLIVTDADVAPFSWMNFIVISRKDMEENGEAILTHELAHIKARHSIDLLLVEICILFQWFNPAVWLIKQELQHIHEFEADEKVIQQGIDAKKYQLLLIKKAVGSQRFTSMANSFNHSSLKKRITMMLKRKSNPWGRLKYLYVLPLAAFAIAAFARPEISRELDKISAVKFSEIIPVRETETAKNVENDPVVEKNDTIVAPVRKEDPMIANAQKELKLEGKIEKIVEMIDIDDIDVDVDVDTDFDFDFDSQINLEELKNIRVDIESVLKDIDVNVDLKELDPEVKARIKEEIRADLENLNEDIMREMNEKLPELKQQLQENKEAMKKAKEEMEKRKPEMEEAMKLQKEAVKIHEKTIKEHKESVEKYSGDIAKQAEGRYRNEVLNLPADQRPLYIIDGKESAADDMQKIAPERILSVSVLKDQSATNIYGEKAKNGVVIIELKK